MSIDIEIQILKLLLSSRSYISGSSIAKALGVSKPTISRAIKRLMLKGFIVEVNPKLGYKLIDLDDLKLVNKYLDLIKTNTRFYIHYIESCGSTQDIADTLAGEGAPEGSIVIAEELKHGRGRMGRTWVASKGGLWLSILFRPRTSHYLHLLSLALAVAVADTIINIFGIEARVKWPNDILVEEKKVAGILIEGKIEADGIRYLVGGIGINVNNELPIELKNTATTIADIIGLRVPRIPILLNLLKNIDNVYKSFNEKRISDIIHRWRTLSSTLKRYVKVISIDNEFIGYAEDIEPDGALRIIRHDNSIVKVYAGDIIHIHELEQ